MSTEQIIRDIIEKRFNPVHYELINESHKHAGHAGDDGSGQTHFKLMVVSHAFSSLNRVEAQRAVLDALDLAFDSGLHAISLKLSAPLKHT